ncbi:FAD/NAD(P)-binding domain-containing protein [Aspergillus heteromorphus CBS 117.55]|uniref:FAD/NAD(P)-binding domain-containing protein n=1 Tax=Aspergillus heteromorphus CBS 117.55 TaxID=1448321 RepID=A0A317WEA4_9EURO|nr:FAD/NAD(P)-binding domain-containing protein [Aspergillus heteromorphus CBS 117.55]PWY84826.1 FAD/NAD(P)-binding domain-containing protein [Aspergillus heteromorphus CBS 117.55]
MPTPTTILIIGASYAGLPIAHSLLSHTQTTPSPQTKTKIILLNPTPTFYWNVASPRILTKPSFFQPAQYLLPIAEGFSAYSSNSDQFEFVCGWATAIDHVRKTVAVDKTRSISYDYLVLASGSSPKATLGFVEGEATTDVFPFKTPAWSDDTQGSIEVAQRVVSAARRVVIGGAGPIGVETAGEFGDLIAERQMKMKMKMKGGGDGDGDGDGDGLEVTLISGTERVLSMLKPSASAAAEAGLNSTTTTTTTTTSAAAAASEDGHGHAHAETNGKYTIHLSDNTTLQCDIYIPTTGVVPNNSFIPSSALDPYGWVRVDKELRVEGMEGVYAAGDITMHSQRLAFKAGEQAGVVAANLLVDVTGAGKRKTYAQGNSVLMLVPVGANAGTGQLFGWVPWGWLVRWLKGRDFMVARARGVVFG